MSALDITLSHEETIELKRRVRSATIPQREGRRARIILLAAEGETRDNIARLTGFSCPTITLWCQRFRARRLDGLVDQPGRGRKSSLPEETVRRVLEQVTRPRIGEPRWSCRSMARAAGTSSTTVHKLWAANDLKPHLTRTFKLSNDPQFDEKFWDVIGLYLAPPDKALVLCCDEKSQVQALERTQPGLPLGIGHIQTKSHDYTRHGTVTLFAALDYLQGKLISSIERQHRHQEWLAFLKKINKETPKHLQLHLIVDNYATHKHAAVKAWLAKHPRFHIHFTPTSSSWMNMVERFFRDITVYLRDGSFASVRELESSITTFMALRNARPTRCVWNAKGEEILNKIQRAREALETAQEN
ncbi:IS630-like element ISPsy25 family transposase [Pseudomonas syringae]|uniref:ISPsy25 transposase n=1 Tax=Pseudomonas syringae pv. actinidiae TaxID=103796 RepID=Q0EDY2_PSESF|nr:IS630-like element ISPsy25 family transposase [Pseudomonas syringae]AQL39544.1 IS630 family transposase [Pseudomonas syringae pv. actinidiae ICMP 9853]MDG6382715.1 IS630-like element ISPsy25 family transposase [Pseudomonas syringae]BAF32852.1 ISPsy25 transposase [Pseudomonas syringae pv. actinidiae]